MGSTEIFPGEPRWPGSETSRVPFWAYTREELYKRELERLFYSGHWCYVGLEVEVPEPGDFMRAVIGERSVIVTRSLDGEIHVVENVCAHRGMRFCRERRGNAKDLLCPYHQWNYDLKGNLTGVPFRRGVKQNGRINGGMPADFNPDEHGLTKLKVARRGGVIFASFDHSVELFEDFLGPTILTYFDRVFDGRKLELLGYACGLDMTRRDLQLEARAKQRPWDFRKNFEQSAIITDIVPKEQFGDLGPQRITLAVDGVAKQDARLSDLIWSVEELVSHLSRYYSLAPGDLIYTGTPAGVGPVVAGNVVTGAIDGLPPVSLTIAPTMAA